MKVQLAKAVRSQFIEEMAKRLPAFVAMTPDDPNGDLLVLRVSGALVFFVHLTIADDKDRFVLEAASNTVLTYPWTEMPGQLRDLSSAVAKDVWRFRISKFWGEAKEHWWILGRETDWRETIERLRRKEVLTSEDLERELNEVEQKMEDAVERVCRHAVPYFELAAKEHGHDLRIEVDPA